MGYGYFQVFYVYSRPYIHYFCQIFQALRLFKALCLYFLSNFPGPTFIPCPTLIPDSRVNLHASHMLRSQSLLQTTKAIKYVLLSFHFYW